ncbi:unnamed protein product [Oppiella nova]|uniref:Fe2OG dioxygenase domain-containing protein n=1 Tax=Oppiella nova TaxID=334625 RepID=A0A7R9M8X0_9ACAR|nr:unnamed protein product [Oppiella nova]CAG2172670.1 unnamed protein product [Oppiella nova]
MSSDGLNRRERVVNRNGDTNEENLCRVVSREVSPERLQNQSIIKRVMSGMALSMTILAMVYYTTQCNNTKELVMASATQSITGSPIAQQVMCSQDYTADRVRFPSCVLQRCGRFVSDSVITESEAKHLLTQRTEADLKELFTEKDLKVYRRVKNRIRKTIAIQFGIPWPQLYLTNPTYFSRMTAKRAQIRSDKYWLRHVDNKNRFDLFTSLLYLSTYGADFTGGRFIFADQMSNTTIEPKLGRLVAYTAGSENRHRVERVTSGTRYALLMAFTCNHEFAAKDLPIVRQQTCDQPFCLLYGVGCPTLFSTNKFSE